jgi:hypothetical protein
MWFLPGSDMRPLQATGRQIIKEMIAGAIDHMSGFHDPSRSGLAASIEPISVWFAAD